MPQLNKLTEVAVRSAKPADHARKLADGGGMYLLVQPSGTKGWRLKYRVGGTEKLLSLGVYPEVSLAAARKRRDVAREQLAEGKDPGEQRKAEKAARLLRAGNSFEAVAREWHALQKPRWAAGHAAQVLNSLAADVFPVVGHRPVTELSAPEFLAALRPVERRGAPDLAGRLRQRCEAVMRYAIQAGKATHNPVTDLRGALTAHRKRNRAALPVGELPVFLAKLDAYQGHPLTRLAMGLCVLTMTRTIEVIGARWAEFDLDRGVWEIPPERMKMKRPHLVPLSDQALAVLGELRPFSGHRELLFPGERDPRKPMSNNTMLFGLYRLGYHSKATMHGFRAVASTVLNETGHFNPDAIERQLAHGEADKIRAAYHRAEYLNERHRMMQWWGDYLDSVKAGAAVLPFRRPA